MFTRDYEEKSLGALILALDDGLSVYCSVNRNFVSIKLSFSQCTYMTATTAVEELMAYIADLDRDICREPLCLDLDEMAGEDYWMRKLAKLRSDMEELDGLELLQHDLVWGYKGFFPKSTTELYRGIEQKAREVAGLLDQVLQKTSEKHLSFYDRFYRDQRAQYNDEKAVADFKNWLRSSGIPSLDKFKTFRAEEIIRFLKGGTLECASEPSVEEWEKVNVEQFKRQVPLSCKEEEWFRKCFDRLLVIFNRTVSWEGDILVPNYACAGLFIFQHWDQLTEKDIQAIFYLDKTLEQIHQEMMKLPEPKKTTKELDTSTTERFGKDTPLSALFRENFHEKLRTAIESWRPYLVGDDSNVDALALTRFAFDKKQIYSNRVYFDLLDLDDLGALQVSLSQLANYLAGHSNLSSSYATLYRQLKMYRKERL